MPLPSKCQARWNKVPNLPLRRHSSVKLCLIVHFTEIGNNSSMIQRCRSFDGAVTRSCTVGSFSFYTDFSEVHYTGTNLPMEWRRSGRSALYSSAPGIFDGSGIGPDGFGRDRVFYQRLKLASGWTSTCDAFQRAQNDQLMPVGAWHMTSTRICIWTHTPVVNSFSKPNQDRPVAIFSRS